MSTKIDLREALQGMQFVDTLVANKDRLYTVTIDGGPAAMEGKWLLINAILWRPLIGRGMPIAARHCIYDTEITAEAISHVNSQILRDILNRNQDVTSSVLMELVDSINVLYNIACTHLGAYQRSISMFEIAETLEVPELASAAHFYVPEGHDKNIGEIEKRYSRASRRLMDILADPALKGHNVFYPIVKLGIASQQQLAQVIMAAGTRTDVNDMMILKPIMSSYIRGMTDIQEAAIDSLSAKKSEMYNNVGLGNSQYANRKMQLMASALYRIHTGDCGTAMTVPFEILPINAKHCVGKFIVENGELVELTKEAITARLGKVVHLRSPNGCIYTDGCCMVCGGRMTEYLNINSAIGIISTIELMGPTAQLILSNKHVSRTATMSYMVPDPYVGFLTVSKNEISLAKEIDPKHLAIGVAFSDVARISDLQYIEDDKAINDQHFSRIQAMAVSRVPNGDVEIPMTSMIDSNQSIPYFSAELLIYIRDHPDMVTILPDTVWVALEKFPTNKPLLRCIVANASMMQFAKKIRSLFTDDIATYHSVPEILRDATNLIYSKPGVEPNLFHVENLIRAAMITSPNDYRIPVVDDVNNVHFGALGHVISQRSIGAQLAFERLDSYLANPRTFTVPKPIGPFDALAGLL